MEIVAIARITINGFMKNEEAIAGGWLLIFIRAFENAAKELAFNQNFYDLINNKGPSLKEEPSKGNTIFISSKSPYKKRGVEKNLDKIVVGTITIRSGMGHGSGFIVDDSCLIITNGHVVGNTDKLKIIFSSGIEVQGNVLRINKHRDVSLLKINAGDLKPTPIRSYVKNQTRKFGRWDYPLGMRHMASFVKSIQQNTEISYLSLSNFRSSLRSLQNQRIGAGHSN